MRVESELSRGYDDAIEQDRVTVMVVRTFVHSFEWQTVNSLRTQTIVYSLCAHAALANILLQSTRAHAHHHPSPPIDKPPPRVNCSAWSRWVDTAIYNQLESYTPVRVSTKHAGIRGRRVHRRMLFRLSGAGVRIADSGSAAICIHLYIPLYSP